MTVAVNNNFGKDLMKDDFRLFSKYLSHLDMNIDDLSPIFCCFGDKVYKYMKQRQYGIDCSDCLENEAQEIGRAHV